MDAMHSESQRGIKVGLLLKIRSAALLPIEGQKL